MEKHRVREGDIFRVIGTSSVIAEMRARITVEFDTGAISNFNRTLVTTSDRVNTVGNFTRPMEAPGHVVRAVVAAVTAQKRGQTTVEVETLNRNEETVDTLVQDYVHQGNNPPLDRIRDFGPGGGNGFLSWVEAFTPDRAGNAAAVDLSLFATNARRKVLGVVWYYHCSGDVATRTLISPTLIGLGGAKPTGFTQTGLNAYFWNTGNVTLTANEEGTIASYAATSMGRTVTVDDGVATIIDTSVTPTPWPLWVTEDDVDTELRFGAITNGEAADTHSAYVLIEEWINV